MVARPTVHARPGETEWCPKPKPELGDCPQGCQRRRDLPLSGYGVGQTADPFALPLSQCQGSGCAVAPNWSLLWKAIGGSQVEPPGSALQIAGPAGVDGDTEVLFPPRDEPLAQVASIRPSGSAAILGVGEPGNVWVRDFRPRTGADLSGISQESPHSVDTGGGESCGRFCADEKRRRRRLVRPQVCVSGKVIIYPDNRLVTSVLNAFLSV